MRKNDVLYRSTVLMFVISTMSVGETGDHSRNSVVVAILLYRRSGFSADEVSSLPGDHSWLSLVVVTETGPVPAANGEPES